MSESPTAQQEHLSRGAFPRWARLFWVPIVLVVAALSVSGTIAVQHTDAMSPVDEWVYIDYLEKLPTEGIVVQGEEIGIEALERMACDGVTPFGTMGAACGDDYSDVSAFPYAGITSADAYTPVYFVITRVVGDAISAVTGVDELTGWRLTGPLWLAVTMFVFWLLMRRHQVPQLVTLGLGLLFVASPFSWWTYSYVSTDAPSFLFGALLLLLGQRYLSGEGSGWWLPLVSTIAIVFKITNILAVCLVALILLVQWLIDSRSTNWTGLNTRRPALPDRSHFAVLGFAVLSLTVAMGAQLGWLAIRASLSLGVHVDQGIGQVLTKSELMSQTINFLPGTLVANVNVPGGWALPLPAFVTAPISWVCIAGVIGAFWTLTRKSEHSALIVSVTVASVFFAPLLALALTVATGSYFPLPPRYGAPILAGFLLVTGLIVKNRSAAWILIAFSVAVTGVMLYYAFTMN